MRKLYTESLRRLAPAGVLLTLCFGALSLMLGISHSQNVFVNIEELNYLLYVFPYAAGAGLALAGFSFLNKRAASDLYLGLPYRRATLFWGVMLSILTWGAIILGVSLLATGLSLHLNSCLFLWSHLVVLFAYWFIAFTLVVGALALGQCLSGQWFFGLSWGLVLLFMGRYILFFDILVLEDVIPTMAVWGYGGLLNPGINLVTGILANIMSVFTGTGMENSFFSLSSYVYSLLLTAVYMALGTLAFCKRKGELSGSAASGLKMQHLLSMLTGFVPALLGVWAAYNLDRVSSLTVIICVVGLLTYLAYELIASRSVGKTLKALGWYAVSLLAAVVCVLGMHLGAKLYEKLIPESGSEIASVSFVDTYLTEEWLTNSQYARVNEVVLTDERVLELTAKGIQDYAYGHNHIQYNYSVKAKVRLKNGLTMYLRCMVNDELEGLLKENEAYQQAISAENLPTGKDVLGVRLWNEGLNPNMQEEYLALYEKLVAEKAANPLDSSDVSMLPLRVYVKQGLQVYEDTFYIYRTQSPEAVRMLIELCHDEQTLMLWQDENLHFDSITVQDQSPNVGLTIDIYATHEEGAFTMEKVIELLREMPLAEGTEEHILRMCPANYYYYGEEIGYGDYTPSILFLAPTQEQYEAYIAMCTAAGYYEDSYVDAISYPEEIPIPVASENHS